jgi:hypothetical protein
MAAINAIFMNDDGRGFLLYTCFTIAIGTFHRDIMFLIAIIETLPPRLISFTLPDELHGASMTAIESILMESPLVCLGGNGVLLRTVNATRGESLWLFL